MFRFVSTDCTTTAIIDILTLTMNCNDTELFHRNGVKANRIIVTHKRKQKAFLAGLVIKRKIYSLTTNEYKMLEDFYQPRKNKQK